MCAVNLPYICVGDFLMSAPCFLKRAPRGRTVSGRPLTWQLCWPSALWCFWPSGLLSTAAPTGRQRGGNGRQADGVGCGVRGATVAFRRQRPHGWLAGKHAVGAERDHGRLDRRARADCLVSSPRSSDIFQVRAQPHCKPGRRPQLRSGGRGQRARWKAPRCWWNLCAWNSASSVQRSG